MSALLLPIGAVLFLGWLFWGPRWGLLMAGAMLAAEVLFIISLVVR